jgi:hypothetical protein
MSLGRDSFSVVGVSQLLESDSSERELVECNFVSFLRFARTPSQGELSPILESRGRSEGGSLGVEGELPALVNSTGENNWPGSFQKSDVLGVVSVGVDNMSSTPTFGVVNTFGVLRESKSCPNLGDLRADSPPFVSPNIFGVLRDSFGVVNMSVGASVRRREVMTASVILDTVSQ